jgi:integrase
LKLLLPNFKKNEKHHTALHYDLVPEFVTALRRRSAIAALAHEFLILTAARNGEVTDATWSEIDLAKKLWTVPYGRMKGGREHIVPLTVRALEILENVKCLAKSPDCHLFPGQRRAHGLSDMALEVLRRRMNYDGITTHGFRSSFRDWAGDKTSFPREVAEAVLAHAVGDKAEQAYRRGSALAKRRKLMETWTDYCGSFSAKTKLKPNS